MSRTDADIYIGVDGGGSRCRLRVRDKFGRLLGSAEGGAANVSLDFDGAIRTIRAVTQSACAAAGLDRSALAIASAGLGLAGASSREIAARVGQALSDFGRVEVAADGVAACFGAHLGQDGGLVIAGTGSAAVLLVGGQPTSFGGRGFLLGDDGSGAWIGKAIWRRALRAWDGLDPASTLLSEMMGEFANQPAKVIAWARTAASHEFAAYAPRVFSAALRGEPAALSVAQAAGHAIAELVEALRRRQAPRISLVGGLADAIGPYLPETMRASLAPPLADALEGALLLAGLPFATGLDGRVSGCAPWPGVSCDPDASRSGSEAR